MKNHVKPFTLFFIIFIITYLVFGTKIFLMDTNTNEEHKSKVTQKNQSWTGIITLWDIPYVETGTASNLSWLNARIAKFEKDNPGIFIDIRRMTPERREMYFSENIDKDELPDIISIPPYEDFASSGMYEDLGEYFADRDLDRMTLLAKKRVMKDNFMQGVPTMMGTYALFLNKDMLEEHAIVVEDNEEITLGALDSIIGEFPYIEEERKKETIYYGFGSYNSDYSKPIISMIYNENGKIQEDSGYKYLSRWLQKENVVPKGMEDIDSINAMKLFVDQKRIGVFLGNTKTLFRVRGFQSQGKGFNLGVFPIPEGEKEALFQDQVASYGIIKKDDEEKKNYCVAFLKSLISEEAQADLRCIGMFPIVNDIGYIYDDDPEMHILEHRMAKYQFGPDDDFWKANYHELMGILNLIPNNDLDISE